MLKNMENPVTPNKMSTAPVPIVVFRSMAKSSPLLSMNMDTVG